MNSLMWLLTASPESPGLRRVERIAELVAVNGGTRVRVNAEIQPAPGPYGRSGLTQEEQFELAWSMGMLLGMCVVENDRFAEQLGKIIDQEVERRAIRWQIERAAKLRMKDPGGWTPPEQDAT